MKLPPSRVVALVTDFGSGSHYAGILHGVLAARAPEVRVIDLTHGIGPQNVVEAALHLEAAVDYFPVATAFCCVVDPGVGTERRALAATDGRHYFVAPDNGLLTLVERMAREEGRPWNVHAIDPSRIAPPHTISATFHARDVFTPVAGELARRGSEAIDQYATPASDWKRIEIHDPVIDRQAGEAVVHVLAVDSFGNVFTTLRRREWETLWSSDGSTTSKAPDPASIEVLLKSACFRGIVRTFGDVAPGQPLAYWGSGGRLELAVREDSFSDWFSVVEGMPVTLRWPVKSGGGS